MDMRRAPKKLGPDGLWEYALRIMARRPHSSAELKQKLSQRADSPSALAAVVAKLHDYGFNDDDKFSEMFASARLQNQGFGRLRILRDLRAKRVAFSVAQRAIDKTFGGTDETDLARQFLAKKFRGKNATELLKEEKQLAAAYRRLRTAGFSSQASLQALKAYTKKAGEIEEIADDEFSN